MALIRNPEADVIEGGTLRLTWISAIAAGLASFVTAYNDSFESIFPDELASAGQLAWIKAAILIAVILAFALIAVADLLSRGYVTGKTQLAKGHEHQIHVVPAPHGLDATVISNGASSQGTVAAIRYEHAQPDQVEYLVVSDGTGPTWVSSDDVTTHA